jgi:hypothetical protein
MKFFITVIYLLFFNVSFAQEHVNSISAKEKKEGWQLLFDGKTTSGWHCYGKNTVGAAWKIREGALYLDTTLKEKGKIVDGGNLVTDNEFENFHLKLEWKISPYGNSGILFYVKEDIEKYKEPYFTGPEMQVLDNEGHPDGKLFRHRAGDLYDLINCSKETVNVAGEWNKAEIICNKGKLDLFLNGTRVVSTMMWNDGWKKMLVKSKFYEWSDFGTFKKGHITLQDHDNAVWYRNIKIKKL